jgi:hypothetical protein
MQQPAAPDLWDSQSRFLTRQGAKVDQLLHEVLGDVRALGDLADPVRHQDSASSHPLFIVAQPDAATAWLAAAQGSSRGLAGRSSGPPVTCDPLLAKYDRWCPPETGSS